MTELNDHELLARYARNQSEPAFATLAKRYVNLVYSAALRFTGNPHHAQEISQAVFIILARKAGSLSRRVVLSGWLYETTRLTASNFVKSEIRRQNREQEAYMQSTLTESESLAAWEQIAPLLDEGMGRLGEIDRNAIVLRFFENKTAKQIATALRLNEAAAHKRVNRALEKLRKFFVQRGVTLSAGVIAMTVCANSIQAAPAGLAMTISATAVKGTTVASSTLCLVKGVLKLMAWTKIKIAVISGAALLLTVGTATVSVRAMQSAQTSSALASLQGDWEGTFEFDQFRLPIVLKIFKTNDTYRVTFDSLLQGRIGVPVSKVSARPGSIEADLPAIDTIYKATVSADRTQMSGTLKQLNRAFPLVLKRTTKPTQVQEPISAGEVGTAQNSELQGAWEGVLQAKADLHLNLRIAEPTPGMFQAQLDSVDQGVRNLSVDSLSYEKPGIRFEIKALNITYEGSLDEQRNQITGIITQMGQKYPVVFRRADSKQDAADDDKQYSHETSIQVQGHWKGVIEDDKTPLRILFHIARLADGSYSATLDSPDQGATGIPGSAAKFSYPNLRIEWQASGLVYTGKLTNNKLSGTLQQGGTSTPLNLERDPIK